MKGKALRAAALFLMCVMVLSGCSPIVEDQPERITVYASFYPIYALTEMIARDVPDLELRCLVQPQDGCLRSYSLSDWDLYMLGYSADALIAGGCGLESFVETVSGSDELAVCKALQGLELYEMGAGASDEESHWDGENPHLYLSAAGSTGILENIAAAMSVMDGRYADLYEENLEKALDEMRRVEETIAEHTGHLEGEKVILMNEALIYPAMEYGLEVDACYERESGTALYENEMQDCLAALSQSDAEVVLIEKHAPESLEIELTEAGYTIARLDVLSTKGAGDGSEGYVNGLIENAKAVEAAYAKLKERSEVFD